MLSSRTLLSILSTALLALLAFAFPLYATASSIDATNHYAWNNNGGWINWNPTDGNVSVTSTAVTGYIWSADFGWINLSPTNGGVTNDGQGVLGGYAWGQNTGWISFTGVTIDSSGTFHGSTVAQSVFGTMTFDCTHCLVQTAWRASSSSGGGSTSGGSNGPIVSSGPLSVGYQTPAPSSSQVTSVAAPVPASLIPTTRPPTVQPKTRPSTSNSQPPQLAAGITITISASSSVQVGTTLSVSVNAASSIQRVLPILVSYRLYPASGAVVFQGSAEIGPKDPLHVVENIPTGSLTPGDYVLAVTAAYGTRPSVTQTADVSVFGTVSTPTATRTPVPTPANTTYSASQPCSSFGACVWQSITTFFTHLFAL